MRRALKLVAMAVVLLLGSSSALAELQCDYDMQSALSCMIPCCHPASAPGVSHIHSHAIPVTGVAAFVSMGCSKSDCVAASPQVQGTIKQSSLTQLKRTLPAISSAIFLLAASPQVQPRSFDQRMGVPAPDLLVVLQVFRV
jgi:hypothetical protein